ncbi:MAG: LPS assembly protein LptD [Flavobacteriales bacterium]|nr:LPS assembly protein LptD [Flavobacteriales bacterium]
MSIRKIAFCLLLSSLLSSSLYGQTGFLEGGDQPVLYYADAQTYDRDLGIMILKGNVEFQYEGNILEADYVTYNENLDIVTASGNVRLRRPSGDIDFVEYLELTGDLKTGIILHLRTLLEDDSKLVAVEARKFEDREELDNAVYTPCQLCGDKLPTWQINARRAVKDNEGKNIHFTDAQFRLLDTPILYVPYSTQPLERRSGFLIPMPIYNTTFGAGVEVPYFIALSEDIDMTIDPIFYSNQNPLVFGQYRQAFGFGSFKAEGSLIKYKKTHKDIIAEKRDHFKLPEWRGHVFGDGEFNLTEDWRVRAEGGYVSDKTYFKKFSVSGFSNKPALTSSGILEGFVSQRDYATAQIYHFQGLQNSDVQKTIAAPLPIIEYNAYSAVDPLGGRFNFNGNLLNLYRQEGLNMRRGIGEVSWKRPWVNSVGQVFSVFGLLRGDLYGFNNEKKDPLTSLQRRGGRRLNGFSNEKEDPLAPRQRRGGGRFFPQAALNWRWPFANLLCDQSYVVQPVAEVITAPDKPIGLERVPNEDSADFEFNDTNLFSMDRFPGYDRIDTGSRAVYGGEILSTGKQYGDVSAFFGQSYSLSSPKRLDLTQGFGRRPSDYVGRLTATPFPWLNLNYRFRLDEKSFKTRVSDAVGTIGPAIAKLAVNYVFVDKISTANGIEVNQIGLTLSSQITKYWTLVGQLRENLVAKVKGGGPLARGVGAVYRDDCFGLGFSVVRQNYKDRDVRPNTTFLVTLFLKNVGDFNHSFGIENSVLGEEVNAPDTP